MVCVIGASYSSAFFERPTLRTWISENPFSKDKDPIFWISDPPHMIKKLRNFLLSPNRNLRIHGKEISVQHILDLLEKGHTNLGLKHLTLDNRTKMNVKRAVQLMSHDVAMELIQNSSLGVHEVYYTAMYIYHSANYFQVMNSTSLDAEYMQKMVKFLVFILKWKREIDDDPRQCCEKNFSFITKQTFKDLTRSIKGFINLVQYIEEHLPTLNIVPRTVSQDDVENYFSLQRARKSGGDITVADFFAGNKALSTPYYAECKSL